MDVRSLTRYGQRAVSGLLALMFACCMTPPAGANHEPGHAEGLSAAQQAAQQAQQQAQFQQSLGPQFASGQFQAPFFPSSLILPTDISGWGGNLGRVKGLRNAEGPPDLSAWLFHGQAPRLDRDPRYSFTGVWTYLARVDKFAARISEKMPALAKVTGELRAPCGAVPHSMPPLPDLPSPGEVGKAAEPVAPAPGVKNLWAPMFVASGKQATGSGAENGNLLFSRSCQGFASGSSSTGRRLVVGTPGTTMVAKAPNILVLKVGRSYVYNGSNSSDVEVESGRMSIILPPGASGIADAAANGLTQYASLGESPTRPTRVVDLCNTSVELAQMQAGKFVTVAPEDAVVEDLVSMYGISETVDKVSRPEGYLLVTGDFSMADATTKEATLQTALFQSDPTLKAQMDNIIAHSRETPGGRKPLEAGVSATEIPETAKEDGRSAAFMPTRGARYGSLSSNELMVADGAVLVRGADEPIIVSGEVNHQKIMTGIKDRAMVMVSALDGRLTVLNLTESSPDSCVIFMPGPDGGKHKTVTVGNGQVAELYIDDGMEPPSTVLAYRIIDKKKLEGGVGILIARYDYLAAMKRFNLSFALPSQDLNKVLKTMAATAFMKYGDSSR